ncbi:LOW QUALITY PROTEIN: glutathione-dependent formaldehyde-activating [Colletotrichum tofieldiae]|nr:LOW QUALITY PROTEIN: glutathione-dependent formaldehyde-activating [Colletotrichum tofieldiae]
MTKQAETNSTQTTANSKDEDWKTQAPYVPPAKPTPTATTSRRRSAARCGQVSYWLQRDKPLASKYCHCKDCQKMHGWSPSLPIPRHNNDTDNPLGAPFQWAAIFHKEDLAFDKGVDGLVFYSSGKNLQGHDLPCKVSCGFCGSRIMDEGRNMVLLFPGLLHFDGEQKRENFEVQMHIFYGQRVVDLPDGKPKWSGLNEQSEKMEEEVVDVKHKKQKTDHANGE